MNRQDSQSASLPAACGSSLSPTLPRRVTGEASAPPHAPSQRKASANVAGMTTDSAHRGVRLERIENSKYLVTNDRGGQIRIGRGEGTDFTAVDLLLSAIGGCTAVDVDILTSRRAEPEGFEIVVEAD